jgi:hypothetical protein
VAISAHATASGWLRLTRFQTGLQDVEKMRWCSLVLLLLGVQETCSFVAGTFAATWGADFYEAANPLAVPSPCVVPTPNSASESNLGQRRLVTAQVSGGE